MQKQDFFKNEFLCEFNKFSNTFQAFFDNNEYTVNDRNENDETFEKSLENCCIKLKKFTKILNEQQSKKRKIKNIIFII